MCCVVGADGAQKEEQKGSEQIDVHIGVFFEGSGLNMVREYISSEKFEKDRSNYAEHIRDIKEEQSSKKNALQDSNAYPSISPEMLCAIEQEDGRSVGFTNVSMLYTLFTGENLEGNVLFKRIYIEGAGTSDISVETEIANIDDNDDKNSTAGKTNPYVRRNRMMRSAGKRPKVSI